MINLLKHEMYKFFRSFGFFVLIIVVLAFALFNSGILVITSSLMGDISEEPMLEGLIYSYAGKNAVYTALSDISNISIIIAVVISFVVINEYKRGTFKHTLIHNYSRFAVYSVKYLTQIIAITVILTMYSIIYLLLFTVFNGWGASFSLQSLWVSTIRIYLLSLLVCYGIAAFINFFAYFTKSTVITVIIIFVLSFLLAIINILGMGLFTSGETSAFIDFLNDISFTSVIRNYYIEASSDNLFNIILCFGFLFVPFIIGGYYLFRKSEIK